MKSFLAIAPLVAAANAGVILNGLVAKPYTQNGQVAGPLTPAHGDFVATVRGARPISLEGFSEDVNQDGFVDPVAQVQPVVYAHHAPIVHAAPVVHTVAAPAIAAAPVVASTYTHATAPLVASTYTHAAAPLVASTYTHAIAAPVAYATGPRLAQQALLSPHVYSSAPFVGAPLAAPWAVNPFAATPIIAKEAEPATAEAVIEA